MPAHDFWRKTQRLTLQKVNSCYLVWVEGLVLGKWEGWFDNYQDGLMFGPSVQNKPMSEFGELYQVMVGVNEVIYSVIIEQPTTWFIVLVEGLVHGKV